MKQIEVKDKWPIEKENENIKLGTIAKVMKRFNITYSQYTSKRTYWLNKYREYGGRVL